MGSAPAGESASAVVAVPSLWPFPAVFSLVSLLPVGGEADATSGTCCSVVCGTAELVAAFGTNVVEGARPANKGSPLRGSARPAVLLGLPHRDLRFFLGCSSPEAEVVAADSSGRFAWGWGWG